MEGATKEILEKLNGLGEGACQNRRENRSFIGADRRQVF